MYAKKDSRKGMGKWERDQKLGDRERGGEREGDLKEKGRTGVGQHKKKTRFVRVSESKASLSKEDSIVTFSFSERGWGGGYAR